MGEAKVGKKPEDLGEGGKGAEEQEVGGRGQVLYTCWNCGAGNWTPATGVGSPAGGTAR